jgi:spore cortex biosynthesis protein YabQ
MISTVEAQFISLIMSIYAGIIIGILFDMYRTLNLYMKPSRFFINIMDLLFWLITAVVVFSILLRADYAMLRLYTFAGICIGIFIYFKLFSHFILKFYRLVIYAIIKLLRIIAILLMLPLKLLRNIMWYPVNGAKKAVHIIFMEINNIIGMLLKKRK